ncbi:MAG TPA: hypothetical protein PLL71_06230 [Agriterribacter sp.]|nr:hypothetical protein [Agriterribacter sp.]
MKRSVLFGVLLAGIISLCWSVYRDVQIEKLYPSDLRNRIVGARLQKDGKMPYFYKWRSADGLRYYNPQNFDTLKVSTSTASPYFHQLLYPIADMEQRTISRLWVYLQYVLLFIMTGIALTLAETAVQKVAVLAMSVSFLFTEAWIKIIETGQMYLFIPFFALLCYFFLRKAHPIPVASIAGIFAVSLVLVRPNTVCMFLPFLFIAGRYSLRYKTAFFVPVILLLGYIAGNGHQRALWTEYGECLSEQVKLHQNLRPASQQNEDDPDFTSWEGWDMTEVAAELSKSSYVNYSENGNVFVLVEKFTGIHLSSAFLSIASLMLISFLFILFYFLNRKNGFHIYHLALLGFCLYMTSDLFSPIYRHQYNTVQWFFPLLLAASGYVKKYKWIYMAIVAGLILNIINTPFIKMEHTIGEYIIFAALLLLAFVYKRPGADFHPVQS